MVQLSHPYMTPGKNIALTIETFVGNVMSLLFNTLSRFIIAFLPRSKHLLISWLQSLSAVILKPKKIKSVDCGLFVVDVSLYVWNKQTIKKKCFGCATQHVSIEDKYHLQSY